MTDTVTSSTIDHTAKLKAELARLDREIRERQHEIECLQDELDDLESERNLFVLLQLGVRPEAGG